MDPEYSEQIEDNKYEKLTEILWNNVELNAQRDISAYIISGYYSSSNSTSEDLKPIVSDYANINKENLENDPDYKENKGYFSFNHFDGTYNMADDPITEINDDNCTMVIGHYYFYDEGDAPNPSPGYEGYSIYKHHTEILSEATES